MINHHNFPIQIKWIWIDWLTNFHSFFTRPILLLCFFTIIFSKQIPKMFERGAISLQDIFFIYILLILFSMLLDIFSKIISKDYFEYSFNEESTYLKQGIVYVEERFVPYQKMQNILILQSISDILSNTATLKIENASEGAGALMHGRRNLYRSNHIGFDSNFVSIPGLKKEDAEKMKIFLLNKIRDFRSQTDNSL